MRPKILVLSFSRLSRDPRVHRQLAALAGRYDITAAGLDAPLIPGLEFVDVDAAEGRAAHLRAGAALLARRFEAFYWSRPHVRAAAERLAGRRFDLVLANDVNALPVAAKIAREAGAKLFLDAHEHEPRHYDGRPLFNAVFRPLWDSVCREYLPGVDAMTTVCESIAREYSEEYGVRCGVLTNAAPLADLEPSPVDPDNVRLVHHGVVHPARRLENMIRLMDHLEERFSLDLVLQPRPSSARHQARLEAMAARRSRVRILPPVPMPEIPRMLNPYDVGLFLLWPASFSYRVSLPNKLFEFAQGRLAVAVWPSPEMAAFVRRHGCGVVGEDFQVASMARILNALGPEDVAAFKLRSAQAARVENAEANAGTLLALVADLVGPGEPR